MAKAGRPPGNKKDFSIRVTPAVYELLQAMAKDGTWGGESVPEVVSYLVNRQIEQLQDSGRIEPNVIRRPGQS